MRCASGIEARQVDELAINIDPIQAGGRLTGDAMKAVIAYGDGYSVCDNCRKPNRLDYISKPPIAEFHKDVAAWLNMDAVRTVPGARRGFQAVAHTYVQKGDPVLLTSLSHYTEFLAVEGAGGIACEIPANDQHIVTPDAAALKIEEVKKKFGRVPVLAFIDHVDYQFGNMHDVKAIAKVCHQYDIPVLYNGAYTVGILPVNGKDLGVVWCPPWRVEITGAAQPGENTLEIEVVNLWPNRLMGDRKLPAAQRRTRTRMFMGGLNNDQLPSGLLGPVTIQTFQPSSAR